MSFIHKSKHGRYNDCPDCGESKDVRAKRCYKCNLSAGSKTHPRRGTGNHPSGHVNASHGYVEVYDSSGQKHLQHRLVVQEAVGRELSSDEHVHHIDGDRLNNSLDNLLVLSSAEHRRLHVEQDGHWRHRQ